jgi:hypothetical protein
VTDDLERAVEHARLRLVQENYSHEAESDLAHAQRQLAASRNQQWAEPIDFGVRWDYGAPQPHLVSNGSKAVLVCHAAFVDPNWDGTYTTVVSPSDPTPTDLLEFTFMGCHAVKFGGPNDEVRHPLEESGLEGYEAHLIHNSQWIAEEEAINSVHPFHQGGWHERLNHYFFVFHDDMFEALADSGLVACDALRPGVRLHEARESASYA